MSAKSRREQQKAELRRMILEAAREVMVRDGYERVSMRRLAEMIEYSPATIYLHFESKEHLLNCLVEESFARLYEALEKSRHRDPLKRLRSGLLAYVDFGLRHPNHYHFAFILRAEPRGGGPYRPHKAFQYLCESVNQCIESGCFRPIETEAAAQLLWASVHGITSLLVNRPTFPWTQKEKLIEEVVDNAIRGLLANPSKE